MKKVSMKKVCPSCGRNRRVDKKFYRNKSRPDGRHGECKDCQESKRKRSLSYRIRERKRIKEYKERNKSKIKKYNADYYRKNKERIMSRRNTESILIIENPDKKKINKSSSTKKNSYDIVIDPKRKE